jgi:hypothetical protein
VQLSPTDSVAPPTKESAGVAISLATGIGEALRLAAVRRVDLWILRIAQNRRSVDLCSMLRERDPHAAIWLLADEWPAELERAARIAGPTLVGNSAAEEAWLSEWLAHLRHRQEPRTSTFAACSFREPRPSADQST